MERKYKIVCLCGSTRFQEETMRIAEKLTYEGNIVLMVNCWSEKDALHNPQNEQDRKVKEFLDDVHKEKIRLSDWVFIINKNGYIGESTKSEYVFARKLGKPIQFLEYGSIETPSSITSQVKKEN